MSEETVQLTEREKLVAQEAANLAVQKLTNEFYQSVGKTVISRILTIIGGIVVGAWVAHGWKF